MSLKLVLLSAGVLPLLWLSSTADLTQQHAASALSVDKRFSINMMDPFTRRSALDKNFVRFGRSNGGANQRVSRGRNDNFVRFGRAQNAHDDDDTTFPPREDLIRLGRARADSFIRFGRARPDNFIRFGRGGMDRSNNGFIRFGRAGPDNFIRFGRGRPDNFIRFGRGRPDNFIRFGRDQLKSNVENRLKLISDAENHLKMVDDAENQLKTQLKLVSDAENQLKLVSDVENQLKPDENNYDNSELYTSDEDDGDEYSFERALRGNSKLNSNFVRFGKRVPENNEEVVNAYKNGLKLNTPQGRDFLERFIRLPGRSNMKSDSFIRFGRSLSGGETSKTGGESEENSGEGKSVFRENSSQDESAENDGFVEDSKVVTSTDPDILGTAFESASSENLSRKKRAVEFDEKKHNKNLFTTDKTNQSRSFYSPLAAGLPGFILGPELSVLPVKETTQKCNNSEGKTKNFIRLG
uniref:FMRFamide n=1 Tax=Nilaparvata lugens TaxID=108931 RepID=U3U8Z6_NILLU|nr:FMRFamide [Nilaparvata lugens]